MIELETALADLKNILDCQSLEFFFRDTWSSQHTHHRKEMREFLIQKFHVQNSVDLNQLCNLDEIPSLHFIQKYLSISHCHDLGAIACANQPIGIDIEQTNRIQEKIVARMSTASELQNAPNPAHLWTAKEACFKALLSFQQPQVMSQIEITGWTEISRKLTTFRLNDHDRFLAPAGQGAVIQGENITFAIFKFHT